MSNDSMTQEEWEEYMNNLFRAGLADCEPTLESKYALLCLDEAQNLTEEDVQKLRICANHEEWKSAVVAMNKVPARKYCQTELDAFVASKDKQVNQAILNLNAAMVAQCKAETFNGIDRSRTLVDSLKKAKEDDDALKAITFAIDWISFYEDVEGWFPSASYRDELAKSIYKAFKETK